MLLQLIRAYRLQLIPIALRSGVLFVRLMFEGAARACRALFRPPSPPPPKTGAVFYYSQVVWQDVWQRPQETALHLARFRPVLFVSPLQVHRLYDSVYNWRVRLDKPAGRDCLVYQPLILPGEYKSRWIRRLNQQIVERQLERIFRAHGLPRIALTNSPFSAPLLERFAFDFKVYDLIDDFILADWAPPGSRELELRQIRQCDLLLTGTRQLYETKQALHDKIKFIPLGVNFDQFQFEQPPPLPERLRSIPPPRIGYVGTLSERVDAELLQRLATALPEAQLVLIGPRRASFAPQPAAPNVHYLGPVAHEELAPYLYHLRLALIPFRVNAMTRSLNPVKTLEYLAAGRVVIATELPDLRRFYGDVALLAQSPEEFIRFAAECLHADLTEREQRGRELARRHSWGAVCEQLRQELEREFAGKFSTATGRAHPGKAT